VTIEEIIISIVRIAGALPVLRWALAGALIAIAVDFSDLFQMNLLDLGGVGDYQALDKWLDVAYMLTFLVAALRWHGPAKTIAIALFAFRAVGFTAFEFTGERWVLVAFPNAFEFWFLLMAWFHHYRPADVLTMRHALLWLIPAVLLKEAHELILHGWRGLDNYTAVEVVQTWWDWLTG
jgi:hypothetical protein